MRYSINVYGDDEMPPSNNWLISYSKLDEGAEEVINKNTEFIKIADPQQRKTN